MRALKHLSSSVLLHLYSSAPVRSRALRPGVSIGVRDAFYRKRPYRAVRRYSLGCRTREADREEHGALQHVEGAGVHKAHKLIDLCEAALAIRRGKRAYDATFLS